MVTARAVPGIPGAFAHAVTTLPDRLRGGQRYSPIGEISPDAALLRAESIGRYLVTADRIDYAADPGADPIFVDRFLWGSARSALIHLRGELPLHASVVAHPQYDLAVAICGQSGAGKSSMAAAMTLHGWTTLADDQARLTLDDDGVTVWPGPALARLAPNTCEVLEIDTHGLQIDIDDRAKRLLPLADRQEPRRLVAVIELARSEARAFSAPLSRGDVLATLSRHIVGQRKWRGLYGPEARFRAIDSVADRLEVCRLDRDADEGIRDTARRLMNGINAIVSKLRQCHNLT